MNDTDIDEMIKDAVAEAIKIAGTQKLLANNAGLSQGAIGKYYRGEARPRGETAIMLERAVDKKIQRSRFAPHIFIND